MVAMQCTMHCKQSVFNFILLKNTDKDNFIIQLHTHSCNFKMQTIEVKSGHIVSPVHVFEETLRQRDLLDSSVHVRNTKYFRALNIIHPDLYVKHISHNDTRFHLYILL